MISLFRRGGYGVLAGMVRLSTQALKQSPEPKPWFDLGLKFGCTGCGRCCKGKTTNVYINEVEVGALAASLEIDTHTFIRQYTEEREMGGQPLTSLKNKDGACILFDKEKNICKEYDSRPFQCRSYPFWEPNLVGQAEFKAEASRCEGINSSNSQLISKQEIVETLILSDIHAKGTGPNWDYVSAKEFLMDQEEIKEYELQFMKSHRSVTLYEDTLLRVVESTLPSEEEGDEDEASEVSTTTTRRLEFVSSSLFAQTEMKVLASTGRVDHTHLLMPSHKVMSGVCELALDFTNPTGEKTVAVLGSGGGAIPSYLLSLVKKYIPSNNKNFLRVFAVETEAKVLEMAGRFFEADFDSHQLSKHHTDGRSFLEVARREKPGFDIILVDAYSNVEFCEDGERTAPPLSLLEDRRLYLDNLKPGGIVIVNIHGDEHWTEKVRLSFVHDDNDSEKRKFMHDPIVMRIKQEGGSKTNAILIATADDDAPRLLSIVNELIKAKDDV